VAQIAVQLSRLSGDPPRSPRWPSIWGRPTRRVSPASTASAASVSPGGASRPGSWARLCWLEPIERLATTLRDHSDGIKACCHNRTTSAVIENLNWRIQATHLPTCGCRTLVPPAQAAHLQSPSQHQSLRRCAPDGGPAQRFFEIYFGALSSRKNRRRCRGASRRTEQETPLTEECHPKLRW
jgi:hypothetical protein